MNDLNNLKKKNDREIVLYVEIDVGEVNCNVVVGFLLLRKRTYQIYGRN